MLEQLHPQIENCPLADPLRQVGIHVLQEAAEDEHCQKPERRHQQSVRVPFSDIHIDGVFGKPRTNRFHSRNDDAHHYTEYNVPPVRLDVRKQSFHQTAVVCFTEYFFFLHKSGQNEK
jgi:hypothetical protein